LGHRSAAFGHFAYKGDAKRCWRVNIGSAESAGKRRDVPSTTATKSTESARAQEHDEKRMMKTSSIFLLA
jgi:hypothetical protein